MPLPPDSLASGILIVFVFTALSKNVLFGFFWAVLWHAAVYWWKGLFPGMTFDFWVIAYIFSYVIWFFLAALFCALWKSIPYCSMAILLPKKGKDATYKSGYVLAGLLIFLVFFIASICFLDHDYGGGLGWRFVSIPVALLGYLILLVQLHRSRDHTDAFYSGPDFSFILWLSIFDTLIRLAYIIYTLIWTVPQLVHNYLLMGMLLLFPASVIFIFILLYGCCVLRDQEKK